MRTDAAGPSTDPHRVLSPREQRIAALESVVSKQHEALQQANETIRQMREEFQQTWELTRALQSNTVNQQTRIDHLERSQNGSVAAMVAPEETLNRFAGLETSTTLSPRVLNGRLDEKYMGLLAAISSGTRKSDNLRLSPEDAQSVAIELARMKGAGMGASTVVRERHLATETSPARVLGASHATLSKMGQMSPVDAAPTTHRRHSPRTPPAEMSPSVLADVQFRPENEQVETGAAEGVELFDVDQRSHSIPVQFPGRDRGATQSPKFRQPQEMDTSEAKPGNTSVLDISHDDTDEYRWEGVSQNTYGAFMHVALSQGMLKALKKCLLSVVVSFLVQLTLSIELFYTLPEVYGLDHHICGIPSDIQLSAVFVFVILMCNNCPDMWKGFKIAAFSTYLRLKNDDAGSADANVRSLEWSLCERASVVLIAVGLELGSWAMLLTTGIKFIMTATSVEMVMRSTVSIVFVLQVDELLYGVTTQKKVKKSVQMTAYRTVHTKAGVPMAGVRSKWHRQIIRLISKYNVYLHLPLLLAVTFGIVFGIRRDPHVQCPSHFIMPDKTQHPSFDS